MDMAQSNLSGREILAAKYLSLLELLVFEIDAAMAAIVRRSLTEVQAHVTHQETVCQELRYVMRSMGMVEVDQKWPVWKITSDPSLAARIVRSQQELATLNRGYASLLRHAGRSMSLFSTLCRSFQDRMRPMENLASEQMSLSCEG